jgi:hypothetical protein
MKIELLVAVLMCFSCLLLHVVGILLISEWLLRRRAYLERTAGMGSYGILLLFLFSLIMLLHVIETSMWAVFYYKKGLFSDFETSLYFSLGSYTTIGYGDVLLPQRWRLLAGIEGIAGVLLCGVSTAFIFAVMNAMAQIRMVRRSGG